MSANHAIATKLFFFNLLPKNCCLQMRVNLLIPISLLQKFVAHRLGGVPLSYCDRS